MAWVAAQRAVVHHAHGARAAVGGQRDKRLEGGHGDGHAGGHHGRAVADAALLAHAQRAPLRLLERHGRRQRRRVVHLAARVVVVIVVVVFAVAVASVFAGSSRRVIVVVVVVVVLVRRLADVELRQRG